MESWLFYRLQFRYINIFLLLTLTTAFDYIHLNLFVVFFASLQKAALGAESTRNLTAKAGRASYIAAERVTLPDPGAVAVAAIIRAVLESLEGQK